MQAGASCMSERLPKHLDDALYAATLALQFLGARTLADYEADVMLRSALERQLEILGEACRRALDDTPALRERMPECVSAIALRNRLAHRYDAVSHDIVLETVRRDLPPLVIKLGRELAAFPEA